MSKPVSDTSEALGWLFYPLWFTHQTRLLPITTCFASISHALAEQRFGSYEDVKRRLDEWFEAKETIFTDMVFTNYPKDGKMYNKHTLNEALFMILPNIAVF